MQCDCSSMVRTHFKQLLYCSRIDNKMCDACSRRVCTLMIRTCDELFEQHFTFLCRLLHILRTATSKIELWSHVRCSCFICSVFHLHHSVVFSLPQFGLGCGDVNGTYPFFRHCLIFYTNFQFYTHTRTYAAISTPAIKCIFVCSKER